VTPDLEFREATGPLTVCRENPRYFADASGRPVYLTGSHTWATLHERLLEETPVFDYTAWLDFLEANGHNFLRLWAWEHAAWMQFTDRKVKYGPNRYRRTGPGTALDGGPKFDLTKLNDDLFGRLRSRVVAAGERGIYVAVMLFQGFSLDKRGKDKTGNNAYDGHPMNRQNNVNGIDGDPDGSGTGHQVHTLDVPEITALQEAFVRRVVDTLNDLDHVLWEISNESHAESVAWQYHMIDEIHGYEGGKPKQHPVGMTGSPIRSPELFASPAEWVSPVGKAYREDPPEGDGRKVVIFDTDHTGPNNADPRCPWRCLTRGLSFITMDSYMDARFGSPASPVAEWDGIRRQMGYSRAFAERMDLRTAVPHGELASTGFCLADPGREYLVYAPDGGSVTLDLSEASGDLACEWFSPAEGRSTRGPGARGGSSQELEAPFQGEAVLYVQKTGR